VRFADLDWRADGPMPAVEVSRDDITQIIFTSGATAEPKGVVIRHRNVLANIMPVEREVVKYRTYARPFQPLRFLNLLPLSHMFGQSMATNVPPMVHGTVIFTRSFNPHDILRLIRHAASRSSSACRRCSPCCASTRRARGPNRRRRAGRHLDSRRWWRYRRVHSAFGLKFWAFVVGAAPLPPDLEEFWRAWGSRSSRVRPDETAPISPLNHPFKTSKGRSDAHRGRRGPHRDDGEILVRRERHERLLRKSLHGLRRRRLVPHRRHRRARRSGPRIHHRAQEE